MSVQKLGAVAEVAAVVGVVVLSVLYVLHARDVKRLREWVASRAAPQPAVRAPRRSEARYRRIGPRSVPVLIGLLAVGGAASYGISRHGGDHPGRTQAHDDRVARKPKRTVKPGTVTVAVLNGTMVDGLAAALRDQLAAAGFRRGTIDVFSDQQLAESVVEYAPGHRAEAKAVGRIVGIDRSGPVSANGRALAGGATVVVIAGADKAP